MCNCKTKCSVCKCGGQTPKIENLWVVFTLTEDSKELKIINKKLIEFVEKNRFYKYKCLFLPRKVVKAKGFKPDIVDILENCGGDIEFILNKFDTFDECMENINKERKVLSDSLDKMLVILPTNNISNTFKIEIPLFTNNKIIFI